MDKKNISNSKKEQVEIHSIRQDWPINDEDYGIGICFYLNRHRSVKKLFKPRRYDFYCISHLLDGDGHYWTEDGARTKVLPGQGILSTPGFTHFYAGVKQDYIEDAICFIGKIADSFLKSGMIRNGIIQIGETRRLLPIIEFASDPALESQIKAGVLLQQLILDLYTENKASHGSKGSSRVSKLKDQIIKHPERWWTNEKMAAFCNLGSMQFRRLFFSETGMTPKQYTDNLKMRKAVELLSHSSFSVKEIAEIMGYRDPFHFSRRFKTIIGVSPANYRLKYRN